MTGVPPEHPEPEQAADGGAEPVPAPPWLAGLERWQFVSAVAYAGSLPLSLTLSEVLLIVGLVLCAAVTVVHRFAGIKQDCPKLSVRAAPLVVPLLVLALALTISGVMTASAGSGQAGSWSLAAAWKNFYSLWTLLPYFWAFSIFRRSKTCAVTAVVILLWISALGGIWGGIQQVFHFHPFTYPYEQGTGFLAHPMAFAGQMQVFSMLCLGILLASGNKALGDCPHPWLKGVFNLTQKPGVFAGITAANLAGLFFAGERSAWLGGFAGVIAITAIMSWRFALKSAAALTAAAALAVCFIPLARSRISALFSGHDVSVSVRERIWKECLQVYFPQSPVFGIGWLNLPHFDIPEAIVPGVSKDLNHAHSNYIHFLTTAGVVGLTAYIILTLATFRAALTKFGKSLADGEKFDAGLALGLFGAAVSLAVAGIFEFNFGTVQLRLAQWFLLGLL